MKVAVRFKDEFEGDGFQDIYDQLLEYLREVVFSGDLEAFDFYVRAPMTPEPPE